MEQKFGVAVHWRVCQTTGHFVAERYYIVENLDVQRIVEHPVSPHTEVAAEYVCNQFRAGIVMNVCSLHILINYLRFTAVNYLCNWVHAVFLDHFDHCIYSSSCHAADLRLELCEELIFQ